MQTRRKYLNTSTDQGRYDRACKLKADSCGKGEGYDKYASPVGVAIAVVIAKNEVLATLRVFLDLQGLVHMGQKLVGQLRDQLD